MALCSGYVAVQTELEVLVLKLEKLSGPQPYKSGDHEQEHSLVPKDMVTGDSLDAGTATNDTPRPNAILHTSHVGWCAWEHVGVCIRVLAGLCWLTVEPEGDVVSRWCCLS